MQVWNKNRGKHPHTDHHQPKLTSPVIPQPSTKNLTDEELKQQYGIHLTSRLQTDGDGKEAKWADIDDDEDDWAPETIEWGDGTKTTVAETSSVTPSATLSKPPTPAQEGPRAQPEPKPSFSTPSIGPNATVLKLGAHAQRELAQRTTQSPKGQADKMPSMSSNSTPAPIPVKSPWAKLPPVEKPSPVDISPSLMMSTPPLSAPVARFQFHPHQSSYLPGSSPAQEISADDFTRGLRDTQTSSNPSLFMPGSGRYEPAPESRRKMSRTEGFRASAVLQRPSAADNQAPEPSAAFQTTRTSTDVMRRRASSTISGDSGQMARRMSLKLTEVPSEVVLDETSHRSAKSPESAPAFPAPTHHPQAGDATAATLGPSDAELQEKRIQQRGLMKEQAELARKRRKEEEDRLEAEKQERIRQKLASLGPDPKLAKADEAKAQEKSGRNASATSKDIERVDGRIRSNAEQAREQTPASRVDGEVIKSPPKPPQPHATGEPQQYGMMKVHALDSVKPTTPLEAHAIPASAPLTNIQNLPASGEEMSPEPPRTNGLLIHTGGQARPPAELESVPEPVPRASRAAAAAVSEVRAGWSRHHHSPQSSNLWGLHNNRNLGNGTFDQTLAGYAPQDLSSRTSSTGQGWMNGRTPTVGQSPQLGNSSNHHVPETRSQTLQNMTSPEPSPLAMDSEVDSMLPVRPPAPIGPPPSHSTPQPNMVNGSGSGSGPHSSHALAGWNNFQHVARSQDRAQYEQHQRDMAPQKDEEKRTGIRAQAHYGLQETFKQVTLGDTPDQRHVNSVAHINLPPSNMFGAVGTMSHAGGGSHVSRGSRFFPPTNGASPLTDRRVVTYSHPSVPRSPSPPPAEEYVGAHPVFNSMPFRPIVRLPPQKPIVKLPPAILPETAPAPAEVDPSPSPSQPMTWAARAAMPAPKPPPSVRAVSTPIVQNQSWQERFNGLLNNAAVRNADSRLGPYQSRALLQAPTLLTVSAASREPLEMTLGTTAAVYIPGYAVTPRSVVDDGTVSTKNVEEEEDLFEDREAGSLPSYKFPVDTPALVWPRPQPGRVMPIPPEIQSVHSYMASGWKDQKATQTPTLAIVRVPGRGDSTKKDVPRRPSQGNHRPSVRASSGHLRRNHRGGKPRHVTATT